MRTSIGILDDGAYEVSVYRTDGTGYGQWSPLRAFASLRRACIHIRTTRKKSL